jgi:predicted phosphodiesterase
MTTFPTELIDKVKVCLSKGFGRRRVAKELGITQWKAQQIIDLVADQTKRKDKDQPKTTVTTPHNKKFVDASKPTNTLVRIVSNTGVDESPRTIETRAATLKVACLSDIHYPYEDVKSEHIALQFLKDYKPDVIVWNGDIFDMYAVSAYEKSVKKKMDIQEELDYGFERLKLWSEQVPATHYFRMGNHEDRLRRMPASLAPALSALRSLEIENNVDFESIGFKFIPDHLDLFIGNLLFTHGTAARKGAGSSVKAHFDQFGCSVIIGHVHRLSVAYKRNKQGMHTMIENGCLCDYDVEYAAYPDWCQGFTTIEYDGADFSATLRPIINHKLVANGKVYMA